MGNSFVWYKQSRREKRQADGSFRAGFVLNAQKYNTFLKSDLSDEIKLFIKIGLKYNRVIKADERMLVPAA